ncbi:MAG: LicD family protein [Treponema sp.]|nr:LicD family protein [Treponema sp.]
MTDIRQMQLEIVSMMEKVDALFQREGITYTLLGGSVLGAVRHGGFIPWDDDMDIGVFRKDFARVEQLLSSLHPYQYERAEEHIVPDAPIGHLHLVNDTYPISNAPTIDVFALDTIPSDRRKWKRLRMTANLHHLAVLGRAPEHRGRMNKIIFSIFFKIVPKKMLSFIKRKTLKSITDCSGYDGKWTGNIFGAYTEREYFPTEMYAELERRNFETLSLPVPKQYDEYLTQLYGDYMMLPPLEQRVPKHRDI